MKIIKTINFSVLNSDIKKKEKLVPELTHSELWEKGLKLAMEEQGKK